MCACPVCGEVESLRQISKSPWLYRLCNRCGHGWLDPMPPPQAFDELYEERYFVASDTGGYSDYTRDEPLHRLNARARLQWLPKSQGTVATLIDVGCAAGYFLDEARCAGWQVLGVDCSAWARQRAADTLQLQTYPTLSQALSHATSAVGGITFFQVLEHLPTPRAALAEAFAGLAPGGSLVIETWNRESLVARAFGKHWQQVTPPSVLHLFSNRSLQQLVAATGFKSIRIRCTGKRVSAGFVGNLLREKYPRLLAPLGWFTSLPMIKDISATYALGDLVTLIATKPVTSQ